MNAHTLQIPAGEYFYIVGDQWPPLPVVGLLIVLNERGQRRILPLVFDPAGEFATMPDDLSQGRVITRREHDNLLAVRMRRAEVQR